MKIKQGDLVWLKKKYRSSPQLHSEALLVIATFKRNKAEGEWAVCLRGEETVSFPIKMLEKTEETDESR